MSNLLHLLVFSVLILLSQSFCFGEHIPYFDRQNFSCAGWMQAPKAALGNCSQHGGIGAIRCFGDINNLAVLNAQKLRKLEDIFFCGWPKSAFNPVADLQSFPKIKSLTIEFSYLKEIICDFPEMFYLETINISWTNLSHVGEKTFTKVHALRTVDLRWNKLKQLDNPLILPRDFKQLYLSGNPWNCTRNFQWLLLPEKGILVADRSDLICSDRKYKERQLLMVMSYKVALKTACQSHDELRNCSCTMHHIIPKSHIPLFTVNCSRRGFYTLPSFLPVNTTTFSGNDNKISDISPLRNNIHYRHVDDVHLDNNLIESIDVLEGGYWIEHFRLLSLKNNNLKKIPVYALDNALEDNANANILQLNSNPWHCTCKFAMRFREIIIKYNSILRDSWNITCSYRQDNKDKISKIIAITREDVCKPRNEPKVHALDWVNGVLVCMILLILGKLAYDYYYYKNHGRVPWIVMKIP